MDQLACNGGFSRRAVVGAAAFGTASALAFGRMPRAAPDPWLEADAVVARIAPPVFPARDFVVTAYGAVGNGTTLCTEAIARAITACNAAGGGRVVVPASGTARTFLTGAVRLRGNVNLHVEAGATLRFSTNPNHYLPAVRTSYEGSECYNYCPLIYAPWRTNVAVTGGGTLDGQASDRHWWPWFGNPAWGWLPGTPKQDPDKYNLRNQNAAGVPVAQRVYGAGHYLRPSFVQFYRCTNVLIADVTVRNAPFWVLHPVLCRNVTVRDVTVASLGPNNDGCDIECCGDVLVQGCRFDTGDDCIALKAGRARDGALRAAPTRDVVLRGNRLGVGGGGVAIGSEQASGVRDVFVDDLAGDDPDLSDGFLLKANRSWSAGVVERIHARNVRLAGVRNGAVTVNAKVYGVESGGYRPVFRDLDFAAMTCGRARNALKLVGLPEQPISNLTVADSRFDQVSGTGVARTDVTGLRLTNVRVNGRLVSV